LIPTVDGKRCAAIEILLGTHTVKQMIMNDQLSDIKETMQKSENLGMKTFDSALFDLEQAGRITQEEALKNADSANNLRLRFKLSGSSENSDKNELLLRGQLPSQVAAAKAAAEARQAQKAVAEKAAASKKSENSENPVQSIHAAMAQQIANHKAANDQADKTASGGNKLEAAAKAFELSLELEPDPEPEEPGDEDDDQGTQFGMGRIG